MTYLDIQTEHLVLEEFLKTISFLGKEEKILSVTKPGEGNMNVVLRITTNKRSFIAKQSRPFVQKYQDIPAPTDRIDVEYQFYKAVDSPSIQAYLPKVLAYHKNHHLLLLEDLGNCQDLSLLYSDREVETTLVNTLVEILSTVHQSSVQKHYPENKELRLLNYQHIFVLPFAIDNGFSLDDIQPGLQKLSESYKNDTKLKEVIKEVGARYLSEGTVVLHGDYYPGSWMTKDDKVYIIDPEFSFKGFAEFDLGVMAAHLMMATGNKLMISRVKKAYNNSIDQKLYHQVAGIEIIRRLLGLAQLPLVRSLEEKEEMLSIARGLIMD